MCKLPIEWWFKLLYWVYVFVNTEDSEAAKHTTTRLSDADLNTSDWSACPPFWGLVDKVFANADVTARLTGQQMIMPL